MKNRLLALEAELFGSRASRYAAGLQATVKAKREDRHGDHFRGEYMIRGIEFLVAIGVKQKASVEAKLDELAAGVESVNALIARDAAKVKCVIVADASTRFTLFRGRPMLLVETKNVDRSTGVHETGHAFFHYLRSLDGSSDPQADAPVQAAHIYLRLDGTTNTKVRGKDSDGTAKTVEGPVGLMMLDPTAWSKRGVFEHPADDADEMFASALEAFLTDRPALEKAIKNAVRADAGVREPGAELLTLLELLSKSAPVPLRPVRTDAASTLAAIRKVSPLDPKDLDTFFYVMVRWALDPTKTP
jgi:hypothetical protein